MTTFRLFLPADSPHPLPGSNVPCHFLHHIWHILTHIHSVWRVSAQVWWTGRCWTRWSAGTGCPVPPSAPNPCTSWCWPAGVRSPRNGPPSNTSRASWKTTSPPLNHSTSRARTSRDADPVKCVSSEKDIISLTGKMNAGCLWHNPNNTDPHGTTTLHPAKSAPYRVFTWSQCYSIIIACFSTFIADELQTARQDSSFLQRNSITNRFFSRRLCW